jgi:hypothetical protein
MQIISAQIENYKSFFSSKEIYFTPGFNIIVGQNNVGKTALVTALVQAISAQQLMNSPHRSLKTVPTRETSLSSTSSVKISVGFDRQEFIRLLEGRLSPNLPDFQPDEFCAALPQQIVVRYTVGAGGLVVADFDSSMTPQLASDVAKTFITPLLSRLQEMIYFFHAERIGLGES